MDPIALVRDNPTVIQAALFVLVIVLAIATLSNLQRNYTRSGAGPTRRTRSSVSSRCSSRWRSRSPPSPTSTDDPGPDLAESLGRTRAVAAHLSPRDCTRRAVLVRLVHLARPDEGTTPMSTTSRVGTTDLRLGDTVAILDGDHAGQQGRVCGLGGGRPDGANATVHLLPIDPRAPRERTVNVRPGDTRVTSTEEIDRACRVLLAEGWALTSPASSGYDAARQDVASSLAMGRDAEADDPNLHDLVGAISDEHIEWISSWLAGEGFAKQPSRVG